MKIQFVGEIDLPFADDRGTYDIWLIEHIRWVLEDSKETDEIFSRLNLSWDPR